MTGIMFIWVFNVLSLPMFQVGDVGRLHQSQIQYVCMQRDGNQWQQASDSSLCGSKPNAKGQAKKGE